LLSDCDEFSGIDLYKSRNITFVNEDGKKERKKKKEREGNK
jgi:hypothetical protein